MTRVRGQGVRTAPIILAGDLQGARDARDAAEAAQAMAEAAQAQAEAARDVAITQAGNASNSAIAADTARAAAVIAQNAAVNAQTAAEGARDAAITARNAAQAAQTASETARDQSVTARNAAQAAQTAAEGARDAAITARNAAQAAQTAAEGARDAAITARNAAQAAQTASETARDQAVTAKNDAVAAKDAAEAAAASVNPSNFYTKVASDARYAKLSGANVFDTRPTFNSNTPWDNGNLEGASIGHGQCRLIYTSTVLLTLVPLNGNKITINGVSRPIVQVLGSYPTIAPWGASLHRYIYAYWDGTKVVLEASATSHSTDVATGVEVKTGDPTRTLVGMALTTAANQFVETITARLVASWFNRRRKYMANSSFSNTSSGSYTNISGSFLNFITWADEIVDTWFNITVDLPDAGIGYIGMGYNGGNQYAQQLYAGSNTGNWFDEGSGHMAINGFSETVGNYYNVFGATSNGNTLAIIGNPLHSATVNS